MTQTDSLKRTCDAIGMRYTEGYTLSDGRTVNDDNVTCLWPDDMASHTLTFVEEDGRLICEDSLSVDQCIGAVMGMTRRPYAEAG